MLMAALSQVEVRHVAMEGTAAFPVAVAASGTSAVIFTVTVPTDELWVVLGCGARLAFDAVSLSIVSAFGQITPFGQTIDGNLGQSCIFPAVVANMSNLQIATSAFSLAGIELSPGANVRVTMAVTNSDAVNARNVTATVPAPSYAGLVVRPFRLVTEIATARLVESRVDTALAQRLLVGR